MIGVIIVIVDVVFDKIGVGNASDLPFLIPEVGDGRRFLLNSFEVQLVFIFFLD